MNHFMNEGKQILESKNKIDFSYMPDQKKHLIVSLVKSGTRLVGYSLLLYSLPIAVFVLILSELIGIIEELGIIIVHNSKFPAPVIESIVK